MRSGDHLTLLYHPGSARPRGNRARGPPRARGTALTPAPRADASTSPDTTRSSLVRGAPPRAGHEPACRLRPILESATRQQPLLYGTPSGNPRRAAILADVPLHVAAAVSNTENPYTTGRSDSDNLQKPAPTSIPTGHTILCRRPSTLAHRNGRHRHHTANPPAPKSITHPWPTRRGSRSTSSGQRRLSSPDSVAVTPALVGAPLRSRSCAAPESNTQCTNPMAR